MENQPDKIARSDDSSRHMFSHGKLSYVQIPAVDVRASAGFYSKVFGWEAQREGNDHHLGFHDSTRRMIGAWITGLSISRDPGVLIFIYVHGIDITLEQVEASGGEVVKPPYPEGELWVSTFRDPAGNVIGLWQQGPR